MDPEALTAAHALALLEHDAAAAAVAGICEQGDAYVQKHWSDRGSFQQTRKGDPRYGLGYWANYSPYRRGDTAAERWGGGWFEWGLRDTAGMEYLTEEKRGSFAFTAGVTLHAKSNPARVEANQQWLSERRADGLTSGTAATTGSASRATRTSSLPLRRSKSKGRLSASGLLRALRRSPTTRRRPEAGRPRMPISVVATSLTPIP
jgi:hypothetical protein